MEWESQGNGLEYLNHSQPPSVAKKHGHQAQWTRC